METTIETRTDASLVYELLSRFNARYDESGRDEQRNNWNTIVNLRSAFDRQYSTGQDA